MAHCLSVEGDVQLVVRNDGCTRGCIRGSGEGAVLPFAPAVVVFRAAVGVPERARFFALPAFGTFGTCRACGAEKSGIDQIRQDQIGFHFFMLGSRSAFASSVLGRKTHLKS